MIAGAKMPAPMRLAPTISEQDAQLAGEAAALVVETHQRLSGFLRTGQSLAEIDRFVAATLEDLGCRSCFLGYKVPHSPAFPSHACLSLNACIVHGTAGYTTEPVKTGDVLKIDIGVTHKGWIGDAAWTYVFGAPAPEVERLCRCGKEALRRGIERLRAGEILAGWADAVQTHVEQECGFHLVRGLGGHGYGRRLHAPPFVSNSKATYPGEWPDATTVLRPGMLLAVEPMIAAGTGRTSSKRREWPVFTADGSLSVHYEHDVLVTEDGPRVLTIGLEAITDVIDR